MNEEIKFVSDVEVGDSIVGFGKVVIKNVPNSDGDLQIVFNTQQAIILNQEARVLVEISE